MAVDVFHDKTSTVPKSDPRIERIDFKTSEIGARASAMPKDSKNDNTIKHVTNK